MNQTVPVDETIRFTNLLNHAALLKDRFDALASASGERFNIFTILDSESDERKTHSAIIADLLNPDGLHGQGGAFARLLLDRLGIKTDVDLRRARVRAQADAGEHGRIDILLDMDEFCIVIENKIYADDQPKQLERYHGYANSRSVDARVALLWIHAQFDREANGSSRSPRRGNRRSDRGSRESFAPHGSPGGVVRIR